MTLTQLAAANVRSQFISSRDGLRLHVRCHEARASHRRPVLCLAGLTRNHRDFDDLAQALSTGPDARSVYALDSRGRGLSQHDPDWKNYNVLVEAQDVVDVATVLGLHGAIIVGTSRGGILAMVLAAMTPGVLGAAVMNDIGPVIEQTGLARIAGYVGRIPLPRTWPEATEMVASMGKTQFPAVDTATWEQIARAWFNEKDGRPTPGYDSGIAKAVAAAGTAIPPLWAQFDALANLPVMVIRGENSDILGKATFEQMIARRANAVGLVVPGQGHAPYLKDRPTIAAIARFASVTQAGGTVRGMSFD